jgi:hypothetical protein
MASLEFLNRLPLPENNLIDDGASAPLSDEVADGFKSLDDLLGQLDRLSASIGKSRVIKVLGQGYELFVRNVSAKDRKEIQETEKNLHK